MKLKRDSFSNALVNLDEEGYKQARQRKNMKLKALATQHENESLKLQLANLENRLQTIESLLESLNK